MNERPRKRPFVCPGIGGALSRPMTAPTKPGTSQVFTRTCGSGLWPRRGAAVCQGNHGISFAADDRTYKAWNLTGLHADLWERSVTAKGRCGVSG